ncbi:hypothetical protein ACSBOB_29720 [Mesorhizobium sp. ASY16-5R]|uniref:hypothetical protein n=1 Tax=Mesorhizobium sp. ASY16-5R TaxID=3445772 RepID=UPI003F9F8B97
MKTLREPTAVVIAFRYEDLNDHEKMDRDPVAVEAWPSTVPCSSPIRDKYWFRPWLRDLSCD